MVNRINKERIQMKNYYFTFGQNTNLRNCYMVVRAAGMQDARLQYVTLYGKPSFAFCYTEEDFIGAGQPERYHLLQAHFGAKVLRDPDSE